ncbi:MAG TPA: AtpZ/AtpI family protein [Longilinea sp.]|nr:AtpZ/AtpI family protein [Longilinea sp.]
MQSKPTDQISTRQKIMNLTITAVIGQVGCLTLIIVLAAVFGGLWLDAHFGTKPVAVITLMVLSAPVSLIVMFFVARTAIKKIKTQPQPSQPEEEAQVGKEN